MALPGDDLDLGLGRDVAREILVGDHDDLAARQRLDDLLGVARGAADVAFGLHRGRGVDIGHDRHARMTLAHQPDIGRGDRLGERAAGLEVGDQHGLFRVQQLRGLGHEMHAGQHDHVGVGARRLAGQRQAVADNVADRVEDVRGLVVVRQDDRVALLLQLRGWRRCRRPKPAIRCGGIMALDAAVEFRQRQLGHRGLGSGVEHGPSLCSS